MGKDKKKDKKVNVQPKQRKKTVDKWKKKSWYTIVAPKDFESKELGETITEKPESLIGRVVSVTGRALANQPKKQHIQLKFKIKEIQANKAITIAIGHEIKDNFLRRIVRRRTSKIMSVKDYTTKDNQLFRIKVIVISEKKASRKQKTSVRKKIEEQTKKIISGIESRKLIDELVFGTIVNKLYSEVKKIVPIKRVEIINSSLMQAK